MVCLEIDVVSQGNMTIVLCAVLLYSSIGSSSTVCAYAQNMVGNVSSEPRSTVHSVAHVQGKRMEERYRMSVPGMLRIHLKCI